MYKRILVATDGSELSNKAVEAGLSLAALSGATVVALKVVPRYPRSYFEGGMPVDMIDVKRIEQQVGRRRPGAGGQSEGPGQRRRRDGQARGGQVRPGGRSRDRGRQKAQVRPDRDGLARPQRHQAPAAGQRNAACAHPLAHSRAGAALSAALKSSAVSYS